MEVHLVLHLVVEEVQVVQVVQGVVEVVLVQG